MFQTVKPTKIHKHRLTFLDAKKTPTKCYKCGDKHWAKGLCRKHWGHEWWKKRSKKKAKERYEIKLKVIKYYSLGKMRCICCKEKNLLFLTMDHKKNDGAKHRKRIGKYSIYLWLYRNNYPTGFQVLCMNCNWGKKMNNGVCPHEIQKEKKR